jgi:glycosyltransferase involved in cell wall biosynthesis
MSVMSSEVNKKTLMLCPPVGIWKVGEDLYFDRKFYDGVIAYAKYWPGTFRLAIRLIKSAPPQFGLVRFEKDVFPATVTVLNAEELIDSKLIAGVDVILASGDAFDSFYLAELCKESGVKCIYVIENTLKTRLQIVALNGTNLWRKFKSKVWLLLKERDRIKAFRQSDGLQANGVPAYDAYSSLVPSTLLYFDTRNFASMGITDAELITRLDYLDKGAPLRLGFSGRLNSMKGADHLVEIALRLRKYKINFTFDLFGNGELLAEMQEKIQLNGLDEIVRLKGVVDYANELVPFVKANLDLFVCCHRQGDPSCTYLETYACGVPIVGYKNQAHQGILNSNDVGWGVAINNIQGIVDLLVRLDSKRDEIKTKSLNAANFARKHTFEATFQRRISQCVQLVQ